MAESPRTNPREKGEERRDSLPFSLHHIPCHISDLTLGFVTENSKSKGGIFPCF
jgi:hypothetical protein